MPTGGFKARVDSSHTCALLPVRKRFIRFTSGMTHTNLLATSMAAYPIPHIPCQAPLRESPGTCISQSGTHTHLATRTSHNFHLFWGLLWLKYGTVVNLVFSHDPRFVPITEWDMTWYHITWHHKIWHHMISEGITWQDMTWHDNDMKF